MRSAAEIDTERLRARKAGFSLTCQDDMSFIYELEHIVVRENFSCLGVWKLLFEILLGRAKFEGVNITAGTLARNERALRFYKELGFRQISTVLLLDLKKRIINK